MGLCVVLELSTLTGIPFNDLKLGEVSRVYCVVPELSHHTGIPFNNLELVEV